MWGSRNGRDTQLYSSFLETKQRLVTICAVAVTESRLNVAKETRARNSETIREYVSRDTVFPPELSFCLFYNSS